MSEPLEIEFVDADRAELAGFEGCLVVVASPEGELGNGGNEIDGLSGQLLSRFLGSKEFGKLKDGNAASVGLSTGLTASRLIVLRIKRGTSEHDMRRSGAMLATMLKDESAMIVLDDWEAPAALVEGLVLRAYTFEKYQTGDNKESKSQRSLKFVSAIPGVSEDYEQLRGTISGVNLTRDLVNEPANVLGTTCFADRLLELRSIGIDVSILEEDQLEDIGMRALLAVGQGSASPSKVVVMHWRGSEEAPLAVIGKGVVFDTGGISLKPAMNMEQMTMDMAGAGVVAGVMRALALNKTSANVVGVVGLVENMPGGNAQRPGDIVKSLKGDTIEVINTDAEGRLVLADLLWWVQEQYSPRAMINLATLTGAIIISLGHEYAGAFSNDDSFMNTFEKAAADADEKVWRQPLDMAYDKMLKSRLADMKNVGNRAAGAITAAMFLNRFVKEDCPWIHLDIAGVASDSKDTTYSPKGPTGWGVRSILRLCKDNYAVDE